MYNKIQNELGVAPGRPDYLVKDILNLNEAASFTGLSKSCIYKLTMKRKISFSKPGGKLIFFQRRALEKFMLGNFQKSNEEIKNELE
jgi:excisionase family DNA binding protein